jgi:thiol-disulfide isomerase/thioredoxin
VKKIIDRVRVHGKRWMLEALLIIALVVAVQLYQTRGLPAGAAPVLSGLRHDGVAMNLAQKVGAGGTAMATESPALVVFWATWCPVCKAEEGNIAAVAADWPVYSVAMQSGTAAEVGKHLREREISLPALIDEDADNAERWKVSGVPTHFVVDGAGNIRFRVTGYATTWGLKARLWWAQRFPA